jgi:hypothetical protein
MPPRIFPQPFICSLFGIKNEKTEGERKMRKESIGRLLLCLLTAFIMVAGVFGAAVYESSTDWATHKPSQATENEAASELEIRSNGVGDAPTRVELTEIPMTNSAEPETSSASSMDVFSLDMSDKTPNMDVPDQPQGQGTYWGELENDETSTPLRDVPEDHGTRPAPGAYIDADGPYTGYFEGWPITLQSEIYMDDPMNYRTRWDLEDDGEWDGPTDPSIDPECWSSTDVGSPKGPGYGVTDWSFDLRDNYQGECRVQAWDDTQIILPMAGGPYWPDNTFQVGMYMNYGSYNYNTIGWRFTVNNQIDVTELGCYRGVSWMGVVWPYSYYRSVKVWDVSAPSSPMTQAIGPFAPYNDWEWTAVAPATLVPGKTYCLSGCVYTSIESYPYYYAPGKYWTGNSPDGIINQPSYSYWGYLDGYPGYTRNSGYGIMVDLKYEYLQIQPVYLEDTAIIDVQNVAPEVTGATATPTGGLEGSAVTFTAEFTDPGVDDDWWYKWVFGDGNETGWIPILRGTGSIVPRDVLVYYDGPGSLWNMGGTALTNLGISYTQVSSIGAFDMEIDKDYDIVIFTCSYYGFGTTIFDQILDYIQNRDGRLIFATWNMEFYSTHGLWDYLGAEHQSTYTSPQDFFDWNPPHDDPIFNFPNDVPDKLDYTTDTYYRDGQRVEPLEHATAFAGYEEEPTPNEASLIGRKDNVTVWNCFTASQFREDLDSDGKLDMVELFENEITWIAKGTPKIDPWPLPMRLEPVEHTYADDHPDDFPASPSDMFTATCYVKDDDYVPDYTGDTLMLQDHDEGLAGWSHGGGWEITSFYMVGSGDTAQAWYYLYSPYASLTEDSYVSPVMNAGGSSNLTLEFDHFWWSDYPFSTHQDGYVELSTDGGSTWPYLIDEFHMNDPGWEVDYKVYDISSMADYQTQLRVRFRMAQYDNWVWEVDNIGIYGDVVIFGVPGMGSDDCLVEIFNVPPTGIAPPGFAFVVPEMTSIVFENFYFTDPALKEKTESFWWRWDFDDGTVTDWQPTQQIDPTRYQGNVFLLGVPMDFPCAYGYSVDGAQKIMFNMLYNSIGMSGTMLCEDTSWFMGGGTPDAMEATINSNFGTDYDFIYNSGGTDLVDDMTGDPLYDVLYFSYDWNYEGSAYNLDEMVEYIDSGGHVIIPGDEFGPIAPLDFMPWEVHYSGIQLWATFPGPAFTYPPTELAYKIADGVTTGFWGFYYALHNVITFYDPFEFDPVFADPSPIALICRPGGPARFPKNLIMPETHDFGDNGVYHVDLQLIDDDMYWDLSGPQPLYMGPPGEEMKWISHNIFDVTVNNEDPIIHSVRAYASVDLCIRVSGTKCASATMTLYENGGIYDSVTVHRDPGAPDTGGFPAIIEMTKGFNYEVIVQVDGGSGGNPTWIFEQHFPDGKFKELKHTFNDEHGWTWVITNQELKGALLGHEIIFEAEVSDVGSDDLACVYDWGDYTPHGINLYANTGEELMDAESDECTVIFDQLDSAHGTGTREDKFTIPANDIRTPDVNPIRLKDKNTHVFDEDQPYYYYVMFTVFDDDVGDGYPSPYITDGCDMEFIEVDLR